MVPVAIPMRLCLFVSVSGSVVCMVMVPTRLHLAVMTSDGRRVGGGPIPAHGFDPLIEYPPGV